MNKFITIYKTLTDADSLEISSKFNFVSTYLSNAAQVSNIKGHNPEIKTIFYEDAITYDGAEAYYVLDAGHKLEHKTWGWLLADIGVAAFRTYLAGVIAADMVANTMFDGVFLDDVWWDMSEMEHDFYWEGTTTEATVPAATVAGWRANMEFFLAEIKAAIGTKLLIINTYYYADSYITIADGYMNESFGHNNWTTFPGFNATWKARMDAMVTQVAAGKIVLAMAGVPDTTADDDIIHAEKFCYSLFLLGADSTYSYFYFSTNYQEIYWADDWTINIGIPVAPYTTVSATVLERRYTKSYITIDATPHTGMIYIINDFTIYPIPTLSLPTKNVSYIDPIFGTTITKITNGATEFSPSSRLNYAGWVRHDAENFDQTKIWVQSNTYPVRWLYDANPPYTKGVGLPWESYDPDYRWDKTNADYIYYTKGSTFCKYRVSTGESVVLHDFQDDFPGLPIMRVYAREGGNPSSDGRYWAWIIYCFDVAHTPNYWDHTLIVYDKDYNSTDDGEIISYLASTDTKFLNGSYFMNISPSGNYVYGDSSNYIWVWPKNFSSVWKIPYSVSYGLVHAFPGCGYDDLGNEVLVWVELKPTTTEYWVVMVNIVTMEKTYLVYFGSSPYFNASAMCWDIPGWAVISGNHPSGIDPQSWSDGEVFIVQLTKNANPNVWRLAQSHVQRAGTPIAAHADDLFSKPNQKGTKIWFRSNWGTSYNSGGTGDAYQIDLPVGWNTIISGGIPATYFTCPVDGLIFQTQALLDAHMASVHTNVLNGMIIDDFTFWPPPVGMEKPVKGVPYTDPIFHTEIVRITDSLIELPGDNFDKGSTGYPKYSNENADGTRLLIQSSHAGSWQIYNANPPYELIKDIPTSVIGYGLANLDARWDATDANLLYFTVPRSHGSTYPAGKVLFCSYNIVTDVRTILKDWTIEFAAYMPDEYTFLDMVSTLEEGRPSNDSRYWALGIELIAKQGALNLYTGLVNPGPGDQFYPWGFFVYDKDYYGKNIPGPDGTIGKVIHILHIGDALYTAFGDTVMSPYGNYVVLGNTQYIYPKDLSWKRVGKNTGGHYCVGVSKEGREISFGFAGHLGSSWATMEDLETGVQTFLHSIGPARYHFSSVTTSNIGYGIISTYFATGGGTANPGIANSWGDYEAFMVELTTRISPPPKVWRLAHTHIVPWPGNPYGDCSFAKINHKGTKVWFSSAWDHSSREATGPGPNGTYPIDTYQINLPDGWYQAIGGEIPSPQPIPILYTGGTQNIEIK